MKLIRNKREGALKWKVALPVTALLITVLFFGLPSMNGGNNAAAFARVAGQLRAARTMVYTSLTRMPEIPPHMKASEQKAEIAFKEPGLMRMSMGSVVSITDFTRKKGVTINARTREFTELDFTKISGDSSRAASNSIDMLRNIPQRAQEVLAAKNVNGRLATGYRITQDNYDMTAWIDSRSGDLIIIEMSLKKPVAGAHIIMSDFKFNVPLDDAMFSMARPAGYKSDRIDVDALSRDEKSLIDFFRFWAGSDKLGKGSFPSTMNAIELVKNLKEPPRDQQPPEPRKASEELKNKIRRNQEILQKGLMFSLYMRPENDWHYAGKGVKFGDATQPVCWWKPSGSKTYRVILGDLSVIDVDLGQGPTGDKINLPANR